MLFLKNWENRVLRWREVYSSYMATWWRADHEMFRDIFRFIHIISHNQRAIHWETSLVQKFLVSFDVFLHYITCLQQQTISKENVSKFGVLFLQAEITQYSVGRVKVPLVRQSCQRKDEFSKFCEQTTNFAPFHFAPFHCAQRRDERRRTTTLLIVRISVRTNASKHIFACVFRFALCTMSAASYSTKI